MPNHNGKKMLQESIVTPKSAVPGVRNTAIIGLNSSGLLAYQRLRYQTKSRQNLIGIIDVNHKNNVTSENLPNVKYLGKLNDFSELVKAHNINHVLIAIDSEDILRMHEIIDLCRNDQVEYEIASEMQDIVYGQTIREIFKDLQRPLRPSRRQLIYSIAAFGWIIFFLPLFIIVSILIKLDSPGSIFYSQERVGIKGRIFRIFKFRTMRIDAEKLSGPMLAQKNDPRITKIGRFLRKTRIDEIPQLINVVIGDMSFIGPRPERPYFVEKYSREIPMYKNRLQVKPGITGLAQVITGYDEDLEDVRDKLKYDLQYIENYNSWNMHLDILLNTIKVIFTAQGH
jgi:exopolysaccharide biosynthesis polyprenyl glycosylphosphotransferase